MIFLAIIVAILWGVLQGEIMTQPFDKNATAFGSQWEIGVRSHKWFKSFHFVFIVFLLAWANLYHWWIGSTVSWIYTLGMLTAMWEFSVLAYGFTRWNKLMERENVVFLDVVSVRLTRRLTQVIHGLRMAVAVILLTVGG